MTPDFIFVHNNLDESLKFQVWFGFVLLDHLFCQGKAHILVEHKKDVDVSNNYVLLGKKITNEHHTASGRNLNNRKYQRIC